jgi:hypothetical protein
MTSQRPVTNTKRAVLYRIQAENGGDDGHDAVEPRPEQVAAKPDAGRDAVHGRRHRSTSATRRFAMLTNIDVTSEIEMYTSSVIVNAGTAGEPLPTVVWVTRVMS